VETARQRGGLSDIRGNPNEDPAMRSPLYPLSLLLLCSANMTSAQAPRIFQLNDALPPGADVLDYRAAGGAVVYEVDLYGAGRPELVATSDRGATFSNLLLQEDGKRVSGVEAARDAPGQDASREVVDDRVDVRLRPVHESDERRVMCQISCGFWARIPTFGWAGCTRILGRRADDLRDLPRARGYERPSSRRPCAPHRC